jgi:hypothetical protein
MPVITAIKHRRGTAAQWTSANPVLGAGEMGVETDTQKFKFGNGTTTWASLGYGVGVNDPSGTTVTWTNVSGKPETFPPSAHTHATSDVTGLDSTISGINTALSGKAAAVHTHTMSQITDLVFPPSTVLSDTAPSSPATGTRWINTTNFIEYVFFDTTWVEV